MDRTSLEKEVRKITGERKMSKKKYKIQVKHIILIASIVLLFLSVRFFYIGFHNVDLVYNYQNIALQMNPYLQEVNLTMNGVNEAKDNMGNGDEMYLSELYITGTNQETIGLSLMFFSGLLFAFGLIIKEENEK
ncbi:hypothetical protein LCGC14_2007120 [marine sediment metagenome]|uniref:Uncharacterized protein n=1 Tax=marine sediment metagenome TaxID=412755 RepID=A0A0F9F1C7_9ZZZZ